MQSAAKRRRWMNNELLELRPLLAAPTATGESRPTSILFSAATPSGFLHMADQCPQLLGIHVVLALETEKERHHRPGFCPTWSPKQWPKASRRSSRKPAVESNGAVPRKDGEATSFKKEPATTSSARVPGDRPWGGHSELAKALAHMAKAREKLPTKQERRHQAAKTPVPHRGSRRVGEGATDPSMPRISALHKVAEATSDLTALWTDCGICRLARKTSTHLMKSTSGPSPDSTSNWPP